jgi:alkanesulfonate monooxygenase SsuD/methylene tetrahydromethanopterin reductase-like flavin-dependent oxidoreductase (luciferase family)
LLRYDLRAPAFGAPAAALYAAALEQSAFGDAHGFDSVQLSEHHGSDDGYLPSPLVLAAAIAGRTRRIRLEISALILPLHDPLRVAEDVAVLDLASGGRVDLVIGAGYVPAEFEMFEREIRDRPRLVEEGMEALVRAWTGEPFEYRGRTVRVTPRPHQRPRPTLALGGSSPAAARRAARLADRFVPALPHLWKPYRAERERLGLPVPPGGRVGPLFLHVSEDPDRAWVEIAPHALHEVNAYGRWMTAAGSAGPYRRGGDPGGPTEDAEALRASGLYRVLTPDACVALAAELGEHGTLLLHPLMGGLAPELGWSSLELFAKSVLPRIRAASGSVSAEGGRG